MTFSVTPEVLLGLLNHICKDVPMRKRANLTVSLSAGSRQLSIIGNGMIATVSLPVRGQGQCQLPWGRITDILATFTARAPVRVVCNRDRLHIDSFSMEVEGYRPTTVPKDQAMPPVSSPESSLPAKPARRKGTANSPAGAIAADGFSLRPAALDDDDCTGKPGTVSPEDTRPPREPVVCPVCQSVGYFKKREFRDRPSYSRQRSWTDAQSALSVVVLTGSEETTLCPRCLLKRLQGARHIEPIAGKQVDMYDERNRGQGPRVE